MTFNRETFLNQLEHCKAWDVIIIGGGATGLGIAVDSATRGYRTLLLEQSDFAKGTSSRSTKLVHGGVRYLAQGNIALVYEALHERGLLLKNAPHLVKDQEFIIPVYSRFSKYKYLIGLKFYDLLAGKNDFGKSSFLKKAKVLEAIPGLKAEGLIGGIRYSDGQFDDARLALNLAQTAAENEGVILNYMKVTSLTKTGETVSGVVVEDVETGKSYHLKAKTIVNATGVFVDEILKMDVPFGHPLVRPSQGAHIVLAPSFLKGNVALMIPKTADSRVLFAVPWHGKVLVGTTDTPLSAPSLEPIALDEEVEFILATIGQYLTKTPTKHDILSVFAGLRPLAAPGKDTNGTKEISRSHKLIVSKSGLITITGGKWTTYRKMAKDVVDKAIEIAQLPKRKCITENVHIHGFQKDQVEDYYSLTKTEVIWMIKNEMARTIEDVLARRKRVLFLDAAAAIALAPSVAEIMASELGKDKKWIDNQLLEFNDLAEAYLP